MYVVEYRGNKRGTAIMDYMEPFAHPSNGRGNGGNKWIITNKVTGELMECCDDSPVEVVPQPVQPQQAPPPPPIWYYTGTTTARLVNPF